MEKSANDIGDDSLDLPAGSASAGTITGVTVRAALEVPAMRGAVVLAGHEGLDRVVQRANIMEVPDILPWVKPNELLLTTGYPLRNTLQDLPQLVSELDHRGLSAMAVKLHRYIDELPEEMLKEADRLGIPLIRLPDAVGFDDILNQVLTAVLNRQAAALERTWTVHHALLSVVLDGGGLHELAAKTSAVLGECVFITTADGRVLAEGGPSKRLEQWRSQACFDESGRFRTELEPGGVHAHADVPGRHAVVAIVAGRVDHGRIVAFSDEAEFQPDEVTVLERAATVAALAVTKQLAVTAVEGKYRGDFLRDVLAGRAGDRDRVVAHCDSLGWDVDRPLVVAVAELDPETGPARRSGLELRPAQERFAQGWQRATQYRDPRAAVVGFAQEVVALLGVPRGCDASDVVAAVVHGVGGDGGGGRRSFSTGVSRVIHDPEGLPAAYEQARRAVHVGRQMNGSGSVAHFDALGSFRLLSQINDVGELRGFVHETLHELASVDDPEMADLRNTLKVLLDRNLNVAEAARELHFHYNTLRYRIGKLERMLGTFTTDAELRLDLALALKVLQMRGLGERQP
ncbi:MAG TPA: PucR family transcriptional regulator ligand-binding domain-containing protein [Jiangellaceae bacterium]|nr:PucR family transcriptional regulator ligand-binding domain-containing protein [Jiangellaceae bacterium]